MSAPLVILIDLDGTIIGNIGPQVCEWELLQRYAPHKMKQFRDNLKQHFMQGLLRPHFTTFIDYIKHHFPHAEFFVYTASETKWAHLVIPCIENITGIQFNRPIFNRTHCIEVKGEYKKSPSKLLPTIFNKMKHKYEMNSIEDFQHNLIMIDNYNVMIKDDDNRLVLAPTYDFASFYDVLRLLDEEQLKEHYMEISPILVAYRLFPSITGTAYSYEVFKSLFFKTLSDEIKACVRKNSVPDIFWSYLASLLTKIGASYEFKDNTIQYINNKLKKKFMQ